MVLGHAPAGRHRRRRRGANDPPTARSSGARAEAAGDLADRAVLAARPCCNKARPYIPRTCGERWGTVRVGVSRRPGVRLRAARAHARGRCGRRRGVDRRRPNPGPVPSSADGGATGVVNPPSPAALCPPVRRGCPRGAVPGDRGVRSTRPPFSCQPMPGAFFFPPPGPDVPGRFSRCASFDVGAVKTARGEPGRPSASRWPRPTASCAWSRSRRAR